MKILARCLVLLAMLLSPAATAVSTIEFLQMDISAQMDALKPISISFLKRGCKKVPSNEITLAHEIKRLAYEKGYTYQNLEEVAKEAAMTLGMTC